MADERGLRADARRNRERVLEVAAEVFAAEGLSVPVHEIARRAGVGTGTVSRHFPAKEDLFAAILRTRLEELTAEAAELAKREDPGTAFFAFFAALVREGAAHSGLADLAGADFKLDALAGCAGADVCGSLEELLVSAQKAGAVRSDVVYADISALLNGCMARRGGPLEPIIDVISEGLRAKP